MGEGRDLSVSVGRPTQASVDLEALRANLEAVQRLAGFARVLAVVKADAYGHGAVSASRTFVAAGAWGLAVSLVEEGLELRAAGIDAPIVVLGGVYPGLEELVVQHRLSPVVWEVEHIRRLAAAVKRTAGPPVPVHLKIDTGMSRLGLLPTELSAWLDVLSAEAGESLPLEGVMTHFACADVEGDTFTAEQVARFEACLSLLRERSVEPGLRHACNSAGIVTAPRAHLDMVRPGLALYGVSPAAHLQFPGIRPSMTMESRIAGIRRLEAGAGVSYGHRTVLEAPAVLGIVPVGYEDGYMRSMSGSAQVIVAGRRCRVMGNVTMDTTMVDLTDLYREGTEVNVGAPVTLLGCQGSERVTAAEWAEWAGVIPWEVLCGISKRVPRR